MFFSSSNLKILQQWLRAIAILSKNILLSAILITLLLCWLSGESGDTNTQLYLSKSEIVEKYYMFATFLLVAAGFNYFLAKWMANQPIFIPPRGVTRMGNSDPNDRAIYFLFGLSIFCSVFALVEFAIGISLTIPNIILTLWLFLSNSVLFIAISWFWLSQKDTDRCRTIVSYVTFFLFLPFIIPLSFYCCVMIAFFFIHCLTGIPQDSLEIVVQEPMSFDINEISNWLRIAIFSQIMGIVLGVISAKKWPQKYTRTIFKHKDRVLISPVCCQTCKQPMESLDRYLSPLLIPSERDEQNLGNVSYEGWICPTCMSQNSFTVSSRKDIHLRQYQGDRK